MRIKFAGKSVLFELDQERGSPAIRINEATLFKGKDGLISGVSFATGPNVAIHELPLGERERRAAMEEIRVEDEVAKLVGKDFDKTVTWLKSLSI
jgi:hypothetical protein